MREHDAYFPQVPPNPQCPDDASEFRYSSRNWLEMRTGVNARRIHDILSGRYEYTTLERADLLLTAMEQQHVFHNGEIEVLWRSTLGESIQTQGVKRQLQVAKVEKAVQRIRDGDTLENVSYELRINVSNLRAACQRRGVKLPKRPRGGKNKVIKRNHEEFMAAVFGRSPYYQDLDPSRAELPKFKTHTGGTPKGPADPERTKKIAQYQLKHGTAKAAQVFDLDRSSVRTHVRRAKEFGLV